MFGKRVVAIDKKYVIYIFSTSDSTTGAKAAHAGHWKSENSTRYTLASLLPFVCADVGTSVSLGNVSVATGRDKNIMAAAIITIVVKSIPRKNLVSDEMVMLFLYLFFV